VIFKGPASPLLQQGTYVLLHAGMGQVALFLVPLGPQSGGMVYEAVFTRLIQQGETPGSAGETVAV